MSGTSMASPHVAGAAALYKSTHSTSSPSDVKAALASPGSTTTTTCDGNGHGYFDYKADLDKIREPLLYAKGY
ncbi:MAG TPA: S8 family serine peptidase, partial [Nitrososphaera sp.]|nr:S8 family serine peptidase [Nitrososphaera sp.]